MVLNIIRRAYHGSECSADDLWTPSQKKFAGKSKCSALRPGKTLLIYPYCTRLLNLFCSPRSQGQQPQAFSVKQTALPSRRSLYLSRASRCVPPAQSETRQTLLFSLEISLDGCAALTRRCSVDGATLQSLVQSWTLMVDMGSSASCSSHTCVSRPRLAASALQ